MKFLKGLAILFLILGAFYLMGPQVENPIFSEKKIYFLKFAEFCAISKLCRAIQQRGDRELWKLYFF